MSYIHLLMCTCPLSSEYLLDNKYSHDKGKLLNFNNACAHIETSWFPSVSKDYLSAY